MLEIKYRCIITIIINMKCKIGPDIIKYSS